MYIYNVYKHTHIYYCIYIYILCMYIYVCIYKYIYIYTYICIYIYISIYIYIYYVYVYIYIYIIYRCIDIYRYILYILNFELKNVEAEVKPKNTLLLKAIFCYSLRKLSRLISARLMFDPSFSLAASALING